PGGPFRWHAPRFREPRLAASDAPCQHAPHVLGAVLRDDPRPGLGPLPDRARAARGLPPGGASLVAAHRRAPRVGRREAPLHAPLRLDPAGRERQRRDGPRPVAGGASRLLRGRQRGRHDPGLGRPRPPASGAPRPAPRYNPVLVSPEDESAPPREDAAPRPLEEKLVAVPPRPGVYLLKDRQGKIIYVGKAASLRARVRTYLRGGDERSQVRFLVERLADFETIVTASDKEALILENNLIKQYRPRYNIRLKDDKSYVSVKVTVADPWPRVLVTRRIVKDGSRYFGPFASASAVRDTLDTIRKVFPLRTCSDPVFRNRSRPCIEYDIKRCLGPCVLPVDRGAYEEHLRQVVLLLEGRNHEVVAGLRTRMAAAAAEERFEEAARVRDQIQAIEKTQERQQVVEHWGANQDVFG